MNKVLILILLVIVTISAVYFINISTPHKPSILIDGHTFQVEVAQTLYQKEKGLGDRNSLDTNSGMLFPFNASGMYGFWMKDMKFPLDIIYINNNKIISIYTLPKPSNNSNLKVIYPLSPSNEVLEINAGLSKKYNFKVGDSVTINI